MFKKVVFEVIRGHKRSGNCAKETKSGKILKNNEKKTKSCPFLDVLIIYGLLEFWSEISKI